MGVMKVQGWFYRVGTLGFLVIETLRVQGLKRVIIIWDGIKLGIYDGEVMGNTLGDAEGLKLGGKEGSDLGL